MLRTPCLLVLPSTQLVEGTGLGRGESVYSKRVGQGREEPRAFQYLYGKENTRASRGPAAIGQVSGIHVDNPAW